MKNKATAQQVTSADLELLAEFDKTNIKSLSGYPIEWKAEQLNIVGESLISIKALNDHLSSEVLTGFKLAIQSMAASGVIAKTTLIGNIYIFNSFVKKTKSQAITITAFAQYYEHCRTTKTGSPSSLRAFLNRWFKTGYAGVNEDVIDYINELHFPQTHSPSGTKVRSDNPEEGWFTEQEYNELVSIIWDEYEYEKVSLQNTLIQLLAAQYGRRPIQMAHLKIADIRQEGEDVGVSGKRILFPGAKEKGQTNFREAKLEVHPLSEELWALCLLQIEHSTRAWEAQLQHKFTTKEAEQLPLFTPVYINHFQKKIATARQYASSFQSVVGSEYLHVLSNLIKNTTSRASAAYTIVISHRTNRPLLVNAYRYRYTRAKQLARLGIPRIALMYWMGHNHDKSLEAYYDDPAERARILEDGMGQMMRPLAQAFRGTLVDTMDDALNGDERNRLQLDGKDELSLGGCGKHGFCGTSVPIPCYSCSKFRPWVYAPHEEVLERLIERQQLENSTPQVGQGRLLISPLSLDKEIAAVRCVITRCEERQIELESTNE
ncbi:hypothetical protein R7E79_21550 [Vibrio sp. Vb2135]|uniref:hypothetical protein n=1 Tax=Vibrio sp. Vb2135 TaxID=3074653 RepID=UPI002964C04F|nr:hypothetical protein [Vibrio sp. Vb2135]MDW1764924.1 hypothetical protein [Vibrio sp. Vb2135]